MAQDKSSPPEIQLSRFRYRLLVLLLVILSILWFARTRVSGLPETPTPTATSTAIPASFIATVTPIPTITETPLPTATASATPLPPSATLTPTATVTPTDTPTAAPTPTSTPSASPTRRNAPVTPTRNPYDFAPIITSPREGAQVEQYRLITLRWSWNGLLAPHEHFDIKIRPDGQPKSVYVAWETAEAHELFAKLPPGRYFWTVQVIRGDYRNNTGLPEDRVFEGAIGPESVPRLIVVLASPQ